MSRYVQAHLSPKGVGDDRPTAFRIVHDEGLLGQLRGKTFLVTGVSSGIGIEILRGLHITGAHVIGTARDMLRGQAVVERVKGEKHEHGGDISLVEMDLASISSVRKAAQRILALTDKLNVLVMNAGVVRAPQGITADGFEMHLGTNHLGHFLLLQLLLPTLLTSGTLAQPSRVVTVSSMGHRCGPVQHDDYHFERRPYDAWQAYGQSKTANIYLANEVERRYGGILHATAVNPGLVMSGMTDTVSADDAEKWSDPVMMAVLKSPEQGAATCVLAAIGAEWRNKGGAYIADCVAQGVTKSPENPFCFDDEGYAEWAFDEDKAKRLWEDSLVMVKLADSRSDT